MLHVCSGLQLERNELWITASRETNLIRVKVQAQNVQKVLKYRISHFKASFQKSEWKGPGYATITNRSQPSPLRGRQKWQKLIHAQNIQTNVREAQRPDLSSPSEVIRMLKHTEELGQRARENFKTLSAPWYKPQSYTKLRTTPGPPP